MPELTKKQKRLIEIARKGGNDSVLPLLEAIGELEDTLDLLKEKVSEIGDEIKKDPPEDVKVEKVAMRLAAKLALKPYPTKDELVELITPLIAEAENMLMGKLDESNSENLVSLKKEISGIMDKMMTEHKRGMDKMYQEHEQALKEQHEGMKFIYDRVRTMKSGKDGKDSDEEKIIDEVLKKLPKKDFDFESLKTEVKDTLKSEIENIRKVLQNIPRGKGMGRAKVPIIKRINLTSQVDGITTTYTLPQDTVDVLGVWSSQFPISFDSADFTLSGNTLTLTSQVGVIQSGQTLFVLIETLFYG